MTGPLHQRAAELLLGAHYAVALTGAGISTPSGIPDFRSRGTGLWERVAPLAVASNQAFRSDPERFYRWLAPLVRQVQAAQPNPAHLALAELERMGVLRAVVTQNIDGLHSRAGSTRVLELHGHLRTASCLQCRRRSAVTAAQMQSVGEGAIPHCRCGGILRPDIVLYGEPLPMDVLLAAEAEMDTCDLLLVAGSSLEVTPAALLPFSARRHGAAVVIVNLQPTDADSLADVVIREDVAVALLLIVGLCTTMKGANGGT